MHEPDVEDALRRAYLQHSADPIQPMASHIIPDVGHHPRGPLLPLLLIATAVIVITVGFTRFDRSHGSPRASATASPARTGTAGRAVTQPIKEVLVSAAGRRLTVAGSGDGCTTAIRLTASETESSVVLRLVGVEIPHRPSAICASNLLTLTTSAELARPLGHRALLDANDNLAIPQFNARNLATVGWLPSGAARPVDRPYQPEGWDRIFAFPGQATVSPIEIIQIEGDATQQLYGMDPTVRSVPETVNGHPGVLIALQEDGHYIDDRLIWQASGYTFEAGSFRSSTMERASPPSTLEHVASSLTLRAARPIGR